MSHEHSVEFERDGKHFLYSSHIDGRRLEGEELKKAYRQGLLEVIGGPYASREEAQTAAERRSSSYATLPRGESVGEARKRLNSYIGLLRREGVPEKGVQKFLDEQYPRGPLSESSDTRPPLSNLSQEASEFWRRFSYIATQYAPSLAKEMFQEEYGLLAPKDKFELNNYLGIK